MHHDDGDEDGDYDGNDDGDFDGDDGGERDEEGKGDDDVVGKHGDDAVDDTIVHFVCPYDGCLDRLGTRFPTSMVKVD